MHIVIQQGINQLLFDAGSFGGLVSRIDMSDAVKMACGELGVPSGVSYDGVTLEEIGQDPRAAGIVEALGQAAVQNIFPLQHIQCVGASRIAYMPRRGIVCEDGDFGPAIFQSAETDAGSFAILDMPTGTGKTIVSVLGAVLFCATRGSDMEHAFGLQKQGFMASSYTSILRQVHLNALSPKIGGGRRCAVFVAGHLRDQWMDTCEIVKNIIKQLPGLEKWEVSVHKGHKNDHTHVLGENEIRVYVCSLKTAEVRPHAYLKATTFYSTIVFDECGEKDIGVNGMMGKWTQDVRYGKMISCSADLSAWEDYGFGRNPKTVFRRVFPGWRDDPKHTQAVAYGSTIFTPAERPWVMTECAKTLLGTSIFTASVKYIPSLMERVGGGYGADLGKKSEAELFFIMFGVCIKKCKTHQDMQAAISAGICLRERQIGEVNTNTNIYLKRQLQEERLKLINVLSRVECLPDETCCICLETMKSASLLQPCMHSICSSPCAEQLARARMPCPTCRGQIGNTFNVDVVDGQVAAAVEEEEEEDAKPSKKPRLTPYPRVATTAAEAALEEIRISCGQSTPTGVAEAVRRTLMSIKEGRKRTNRSHDTLLVMVIIPGVDVREGLFDGLGFDDAMYHRSKGSRGDRVYQTKIRAQLKAFEKKDGRSKILFVRDGHTDCMTGLDIDGLDAVISVGAGNFAQRLGRLCRFSRVRLPVEKRHAVYVEITPRR